MLREGQRRRWCRTHAAWLAAVLLATAAATAQTLPSDKPPSTAPAGTARVSGRLVARDGRVLASATVIMTLDAAPGGGSDNGVVARLESDGRFVFENVPPGRYFIHARGESAPDAPSLFATFTVTVAGRDVSGLIMSMTPGGVLEGRVEMRSEHGARKPAGPLRVRAPLADGAAMGDTLTGTVGLDGRFRLAGVMPGSHVLVVEGLTFPWRLASAQVRGQDLAETSFDVVHDEQVRELRIVITDSAGGVGGTVAMPHGIEPRRVVVVSFPRDPLRRQVPLRFVRTTRPADDGTYRLVDLVPGEHLVAAAIDFDDGPLYDAGRLGRLVGIATPVTIRESEMTTASLQAVVVPEP
jgi:hypothetical protein